MLKVSALENFFIPNLDFMIILRCFRVPSKEIKAIEFFLAFLHAFQRICRLLKYWQNYLARIHISFEFWQEKVAKLVAKHRKKYINWQLCRCVWHLWKNYQARKILHLIVRLCYITSRYHRNLQSYKNRVIWFEL